MRTITRHGFYYPEEKWADNRAFYRRCVKDSAVAQNAGISQKKAQENLAFLERFLPEVPHSRLVGHEITVYKNTQPVWRAGTRGQIEPTRAGQIVSQIDLGTTILDICERGLGEEEVLEHEYEVDLGDGTFVYGTRVRKSTYLGPANRKILPHKYLDITFDQTGFARGAGFGYTARLKREGIIPEEPLHFLVRPYIMVDNQLVKSAREIAVPQFRESKNNAKKFSHFAWRAVR